MLPKFDKTNEDRFRVGVVDVTIDAFFASIPIIDSVVLCNSSLIQTDFTDNAVLYKSSSLCQTSTEVVSKLRRLRWGLLQTLLGDFQDPSIPAPNCSIAAFFLD